MGPSFGPSTSAASISSTPADPYSVCSLPGRPVSCSSLDSGDGERALSRRSDVTDSLPLGEVQERSAGFCRTDMNAKSRYVTGPADADGVPLAEVPDGVEVKQTCVNSDGSKGMSFAVSAGREENSAVASVVTRGSGGNMYGGVVGYTSNGPKIAAQGSSPNGEVTGGISYNSDEVSAQVTFNKSF